MAVSRKYIFLAVNVVASLAVDPSSHSQGILGVPLGSPLAVANAAAASLSSYARLATNSGASLPAVRSLAADGMTFASVGCQAENNTMPPYNAFMPACVKHLRQLIAEVDGSYTDIQLEAVLEHECWYSKKFPRSCDSGFEETKHCRKFAQQLVTARDDELQTGSKSGYHQACEDYFILRGGVMPSAGLEKKSKFVGGEAPMFDKESMPPVSTTLYCVMNLSLQYFLLYTALAIVQTLNSFKFQLEGVQQILESGCTTVTYAPMLCVLFLGARMRAIQLSQGETEKYQLPQPWVQSAMVVASSALVAQVVLVLLVGFMSGLSKVKTDSEGHLDVTSMTGNPVAVKLLTIVRYFVMAMLYGGFTCVVLGVFLMRGPREIWGNQQLPVSPAVMCTILLSGIFFLVYLLTAIVKTCFELSPVLRSSGKVLLQLEAGAKAAKMTVNFAPMLCILFIGARMRALQIDPKLGNPQSWAQKCFFLCTLSVLVQALLCILLPFLAKGKLKPGSLEGDVAFQMDNPSVGKVMTAIRYLCLLALYIGIAVVIYSVYVIEHPEGREKTPPVSPAMQCVITLTVQYFLIYIILFLCITAKSFLLGKEHSVIDRNAPQEDEGLEDGVGRRESEEDTGAAERAMNKAIAIFDAARSTVMFAPMLSILFIGARMRALQLTKAKNGTIPPNAGPQKWVQDGMFLATWSVFVQLIMTMLVPILTGSKAELGKDGIVKVPPGTPKSIAIVVEAVRYFMLLCMYGGAVVVMYGVLVMTPDNLPPYNEEHLIPGVTVARPPVPVDAKTAAQSLSVWPLRKFAF
jgi:hypothetical protein